MAPETVLISRSVTAIQGRSGSTAEGSARSKARSRKANVNARTKEQPPLRRWLMPLSDISWVDFTGQTPFLRAALSADLMVMRLLLDKGADPNIATFAGTTPLMAAAGVNYVGGQTYSESKQFLEAVELCLEKGADVIRLQAPGSSALHLFPDFCDGARIEPFGGQLALADQGLDLLLVDYSIHGCE